MGDSVILAGDVGATKTVLGLFSANNGGRPALISQQTFRSSAHSGLTDIVREFLPESSRVKVACFGVAGPVIDGVGEVTNLSWTVRARTLSSDLQIDRVSLINDLVATGYGVASLNEEDLLVLNQGRFVEFANAAVIAAGTGLGECILYRDGRGYVPLPSEAGHADFAPHDEITLELAHYLRQKTGVACVEHVVSGPGLVNIYNFLRDRGDTPGTILSAEKMLSGDLASVIAQAALENRCQLCVRALDIFVSAYGAEAGNLAVRSMAVGGIYLAGGIAPKIRTRLQKPGFMEAFVNKWKQTELLAQIPVRVILNENLPLLGAVRYLTQLG
jgi:glucokinase